MRKKFNLFFASIALFALLPAMVNAEAIVETEQELLEALNTDETVIVLGNDLETTQKINILRDVTIDGAGHAITYNSLVNFMIKLTVNG